MATVEAVLGDITREQVDAVVNAANSSLLGGGGVDGAIHAAAGPALLAECRALRKAVLPQGLPVGEAVATGAGELAATWVVHTVGPNRHAGEVDPRLLASCFARSLTVAADVGARSVAFPAVGAGLYGWDVEVVADVAVDALVGHPALAGPQPAVDLVRFVLVAERGRAAFRSAIQHHLLA
jgi:O-acetyl-ADP-ribose deacetylase (regulator of RNase III)